MSNFNQRLNGLNPLSYIGANALQPPDFLTRPRPPTINDSKNFQLGQLWLDNGTNTPPTNEDVYMLVSLIGNEATWVSFGGGGDLQFLTGNSGGPVAPDGADNINILGTGVITVVGNPGTNTLTITPSGAIASSFPTDSGTAIPAAGALTIHGSHGLNTSGAGSTVTVAINNAITLGDLTPISASNNALTVTTGDISVLTHNINMPVSNSTSSEGVITWENGMGGGQIPLISFYGNNVTISPNVVYPSMIVGTAVGNYFIGGFPMNITTGQDNSVFGGAAGTALTTGSKNCLIGQFCGDFITTGGLNTVIGNDAASGMSSGLVSGVDNIIIGNSSGASYTGGESRNILLGSGGVVGESNTFRVSNSNSPLTRAFIEGIRGITTANNNAIAVLIDSAGQLGTVSSSARYKENIEDMGSDSNVLHKLRPVVFNYKKHSPQDKSVGLIAEEVAVVAPNLVVYDKDGIPLTVKYHDLVPMLLNEFKKHCNIIADRDTVIADLLNRVRILEEQLLKRS